MFFRCLIRILIYGFISFGIVACGSGSSTSPPPTEENTVEASVVSATNKLFFAAEHVYFASRSLSSSLRKFLAISSQNVIACENGGEFSVQVLMESGDGLVSSGDTLEFDYLNCNDSIGTINGKLRLDISLFDINAFGEVQIIADIFYHPGFQFNDTTLGGEYTLTYQSTYRGEGIIVTQVPNESFEIDDLSVTSLYSYREYTIQNPNAYDYGRQELAHEFELTLSGLDVFSPLHCVSGMIIPDSSGSSYLATKKSFEILCNSETAELRLEANGFGLKPIGTDVTVYLDDNIISSASGKLNNFIGESYLSTEFIGSIEYQIEPYTTERVSIKSNDADAVLNDPFIYIATSSEDVNYPSAITKVDVETKTVVDSVSYSDEPVIIELSEDGNYIYVGFRDSNILRQLDAGNLSLIREIDLGTTSFNTGINIPVGIAVSPANNEEIVVSTQDSDSTGSMMQKIVSGITMQDTITLQAAGLTRYSSDGTKLYGLDTTSSSTDLLEYVSSPTGLSLVDEMPGSINSHEDIYIKDGLIYTTYGRVIDFTNKEFVGFNKNISGWYRVKVLADDRFTYLVNDYLQIYERDTFLPVTAIKIGDNTDIRAIEILKPGLILVVTTDEAVFIDIDSLPLWPDQSCELTKITDIIKNTTYDYMPCPVNDIARHGSDLYMSIPSNAGKPNGNQILKLNLDTRVLTDSYPAGPEPESLAVSDDASRIYVALDGISQFEEIDVATNSSLYRTEVGSDYGGHYSVGKIQTRPDNPGEVAVLVVNKNYLNDPSERLTLFRDGIEQTGQDLFNQKIDTFGFIDSDTIAGIYVSSTAWRYHAFSASSTGIDLLMEGDTSWEFGFQTDMALFENQLISSSGVALDISNPLSPFEIAGFDTGIDTVNSTFGGLANSKVIVNENNREVYVYAEYLNNKVVPVVQRFNFDTKEKTGEISLPRYGFSSSAVTAFEEHNDTIVISSGQGVLFLNKMLFEK